MLKQWARLVAMMKMGTPMATNIPLKRLTGKTIIRAWQSESQDGKEWITLELHNGTIMIHGNDLDVREQNGKS
jgi:hypothetical protein